ncbi:TraX family protein [Streptococcus oricebi]|uniref:TraX protein n=1 Tax=Streptococcus oricebi TaxID=1547447 RepID=A0ABS5B101_9STRE|nr:TraX family protein [Streptococcus oricebi]MBP2622509.1 hypothetical protein [Streptococcus oricebi]
MNVKKFATASNLKYLAAFCMFLDHIHEMFATAGAPSWLTMLGRIVFPIFLFLAADSFYYTSNRKAYMKRLYLAYAGMVLLTALLTSIFPTDRMMLANNAFGTFFMTGLYIYSYDLMRAAFQKGQAKLFFKGLGLAVLPLLTFGLFFLYQPVYQFLPYWLARPVAILLGLIPSLFTVEGGYIMVGLGLFFYIFRKHRWLQLAGLVALSVYIYLLDPISLQWMMVFAALPMALYNGQKGSGSKSFFYIFYPSHLAFLYILSVLLLG